MINLYINERQIEDVTVTNTKLLPVFDVHDDEPKALASFDGETLKIVERQPFFM